MPRSDGPRSDPAPTDAVDGLEDKSCYAGPATKLGGGNAAACGKRSWLKAVRAALGLGIFPCLFAEGVCPHASNCGEGIPPAGHPN